MTPNAILYSFEGRIDRETFWVRWLGLSALGLTVGFAIRLAGWDPFTIALGVLMIPMVWANLAIQVKRLHDIGCSGWMTLIVLIPFIGVIALICLGCIKGTAGPNKYGDDPLQRAVTRRQWRV